MSDAIVDQTPAAAEEPSPAPRTGIVARLPFYVGSLGLLLAMAADGIAVLGRHAGFALLGAIEIVQVAIVLIAASAMVSVTLARGHAAVHILTERLGAGARARLALVADVLSAATLLILAAGSAMILIDLWGGYERSELLHVPLRWLRLLVVIALLTVAGLFVRHAVGRRVRDA